jgi:PAS domain S-box-containing protein
VNAAPTIEAAFDLLAERARILLSADGTSVVAWDPERRAETVLATAGRLGAGGTASSVSVPLSAGGYDSLTLEAAWRMPCTRAHLDTAVAMLTDLAGLTRVAVRSRVERVASRTVPGYVEDLLEALPTAAYVADPETGALVLVNRALTELTGYSPGDLLGVEPPHVWVRSAEGFRPGGETVLVRHRGGRVTPVEIRRLPVRDADGEVSAWISLLSRFGEGRRSFLLELPAQDSAA